jgi:hypothetical protein
VPAASFRGEYLLSGTHCQSFDTKSQREVDPIPLTF